MGGSRLRWSRRPANCRTHVCRGDASSKPCLPEWVDRRGRGLSFSTTHRCSPGTASSVSTCVVLGKSARCSATTARMGTGIRHSTTWRSARRGANSAVFWSKKLGQTSRSPHSCRGCWGGRDVGEPSPPFVSQSWRGMRRRSGSASAGAERWSRQVEGGPVAQQPRRWPLPLPTGENENGGGQGGNAGLAGGIWSFSPGPMAYLPWPLERYDW